MLTESMFWGLGLGVVQSAAFCTAVLVGGFFLVRGVLHGLDSANRTSRRGTTLVTEPAASLTLVSNAQETQPHVVLQ